MSTASGAYWLTEAEDEAMQDEHGFIWKAMLDTIDVDVRGARVLDAGCNRGGFLRLLCDGYDIGAGSGYDPASAAIADARRLAGDRPLVFEAGDTVPSDWTQFDVAFSHEVLYLIHDLARHARGIYQALAPGGIYYAVMGIHADSPGMVEWHQQNLDELNLPQLYALDDVIGVFTAAGFQAAVARLNIRFIPVSGHATTFPRGLEYFYEHKVMMRFVKPRS